MKIKNNKGFTLLELLVAIFIFTTVIFIGYKIIDKSTIAIKDQGNINKGQLTMNDMNNYLTKDLEQAENVVIDILRIKKESNLINSNDEEENLSKLSDEYTKFINDSSESKLIQYTYTIKTKNENSASLLDDKKIVSKYKTIVEYRDNRYSFTVSRVDYNNVKIDFVNNEILKELNTAPFIISGSGLYKVNMQYEGKNSKIVKHKFDIVSRYNSSGGSTETTPKPPKPEELPEPPEIKKDYAIIGYWIADNEKCITNNLYTWIGYKGIMDSNYGLQNIEKNEFTINANMSANDSSGHGDQSGKVTAHIDDSASGSWNATANHKAISSKDIETIMIYVEKFTNVNYLEDRGNYIKELSKIDGSGTLTYENKKWDLYGGDTGTWYKATINSATKGKKNFNLYGKLSINKTNISSGYALVIYTSGKSDKPDKYVAS